MAIDASRTIRIGTNEPITVLSNAATDQASRSALPFIFNALYQLDPTLAPVSDLAAEPCGTSADGLTWTCTLREARFHSGLPVTAEDVAYTYGLARSPRCTFRAELCLATLLERVEATDDRTVSFTLAEPYAPFATLTLDCGHPLPDFPNQQVVAGARIPLLSEVFAWPTAIARTRFGSTSRPRSRPERRSRPLRVRNSSRSSSRRSAPHDS